MGRLCRPSIEPSASLVLIQVGDALGIDRLELDVYTDNHRAIALYEQFGFVREGVKRIEAWRDDAYVDALVMGRLRRPR